MKINNFCLIVGTQKGGTSSLFSYLSQHPQISSSKIKETNFFSEDHEWNKGLAYYENLWQWNSQKHLIALEASPNYTNSLDEAGKVVQRTQTIDANFRFVYVLRNPLQKIESMRKQGVYQGWYADFLKRETPTSVPMEVIESVRYADVIDKFVDKFSRDRILLLKTEDLDPQGKPAIAMNQICNFLEIDPTFEFSLEKIHNAQNSYRRDTLWHYLRSLKYFSLLKKIVPDTLKNKARNILSKPLKNNAKVVPPLTAAQKRFIYEALSDERTRLAQDYNLNIANWHI